ncbi:MAG: alpha/beta hydrolase [Bdellovibrionales bacterium]|nr:alpha/beta hydrolase [Bdellovibrionales bacterium]
MKKRRLIFLTFLSIPFSIKASELSLPTPENYLGGFAYCSSQSALIGHEKGFYTQAPVNYTNLQSEKFDIYSWFQEPYDPNRPTVVYLTGGPGQTSHWGQSALTGDYNLLLVDQRGIACSRPRTYEDYLSPDFYSAKNIAMDLEEIRKKLNIEKWTVYGVSFGTIPATIYGSMFPKHTRSVILEGVAYDAQGLWNNEQLKKILKEEIEAQPLIVQEKLRNLSQTKIDPMWFFMWAKTELLMNEGRQTLKENLLKLSDPLEYEDFLSMLETQFVPQVDFEKNDLFQFNEIAYYMNACQELGLLNYKSELTFSATGEIIPAPNTEALRSCAKLNLEPTELFSASSYPLKVPTFYFQGENDSATSIQGSYKHFKEVATGVKQFFFLKDGGHNPNLEILRDDNEGEKQMVANAINGELTSREVIDALNSELSLVKWISK